MVEFTMESRQAEQSRISGNWISRIRQCLVNHDEPQILQDALREAMITPAHLDGRLILTLDQVDKVV